MRAILIVVALLATLLVVFWGGLLLWGKITQTGPNNPKRPRWKLTEDGGGGESG